MIRFAQTSRHRTVRAAILTTTFVLALVCSATQGRADLGDCGQPISAGVSPVATDALFVLGAAVGTQSCEACVCDVNDDGAVTATDALIDLSAAVGQAVSLDCSSCAIECPQDDGCELSDGMVEEGEPLLLETSGGRVMVPADALPEGIIVTLREMTPELADSLPDGPGEELLSNIFDLTLSDAVQPVAPIVLEASVADPVPTYFSGRLKVIDAPFPTEATEESWQVYVGRFDQTTSRLAFTIFGALNRVSAAVVVPTEELVDVLRKTKSESHARSASMSGATAQAATVAQTSKLGEHGWAVTCLGLQYALLDIEDPSCDPNDLALVVAEEFQKADVFIRSLGLENLRMKTVTRADLERSFLTVAYADPEGVSGELPSAEYFLGFMTPLVEKGVAGDYDSTTGLIRVGAHSGFLLQEQGNTIAHELMHAVQYGTAPGMADARWTIEGIADAVGFAFTEPAAETRLAHRRDDIWRDWNDALNSEDDDIHVYQTTEFWFSVGGGDLGYLTPLYESLASSGAPSPDESYRAVSDALNSAGLGGGRALADQYLALLQKRNEEEGYPHCSSKSCTLGMDCMGETIGSQDTMSAECIDVTISGADGPSCLSVVAERPNLGGALQVMIAGQIYDEGKVVEVEDEVRVWPINYFYEDQNDIGYGILVEGCDDAFALRRQRFVVDVGAVATTASQPPSSSGAATNEIARDFHTSVEDQPDQSTRLFRRGTSLTGIEETEEPIPAIGFERFELTHAVAAEWQAEPPRTTFRQASASGSLESETDRDGTALITNGTLEAFASSTDPSGSLENGLGIASATYYYQTFNAQAEVTLTWPCTFSHALLFLQSYPNGPVHERLLDQNRLRTNVEFQCGTETWVVPAFAQFQIHFQATYYSNSEGPLAHPVGQNPGGDYKIEIRPVTE